MICLPRGAAVIALLTVAAAGADTLPSAAALQAMADSKDWPGLLAGTSRALALRTPAAAYDRYDLWTKKAEAHLQLSQFGPASQSLASAAKETKITEKQRDTAVATARLLRKSTPKGYEPPTTDGLPQRFDILDTAIRPKALTAMLDGEIGDLKRRIGKFNVITDAKAMADAAKQLIELRPLDRVIHDSTEQTDVLEKTLGERFSDEVDEWARAADQRLAAIEAGQRFVTKGGYDADRVKHKDGVGIKGRSPQEDDEMRRYVKEAQVLAKSYTTLHSGLSEVGQEKVRGSEKRIEMIYYRAQGYIGVPENKQR
ncbi:MAG TPA: hypothetical protein VF595_12720 [Tepidisphaeraceae bacterium]|jgi:hypothetical protein